MQKTLTITQSNYQQTVHLTIPLHKKTGTCCSCQSDKPIYLITQKQGETDEKNYC